MLALIKFFSDNPCPRCLVPKEKLQDMGKAFNMKFRAQHVRRADLVAQSVEKARKCMFEHRYSINRAVVKYLLEGSLYPVRNALMGAVPKCLNFYNLFTPDILHEMELGIWKDLFIHLLRILQKYFPAELLLMNGW